MMRVDVEVAGLGLMTDFVVNLLVMIVVMLLIALVKNPALVSGVTSGVICGGSDDVGDVCIRTVAVVMGGY